MSVPFLQKAAIAGHIAGNKIRGHRQFPLVLMLEPLFKCNLACRGCGKIRQPQEIINRLMTRDECYEAVKTSGAPVVSMAGGEPLLHKDMPEIISGITARKKFVYLCTNGLLLEKCISDYTPSPYLTFSLHIDGDRAMHDRMTNRPGMFDSIIRSAGILVNYGFRFTINCTLYKGNSPDEIAGIFDRFFDLGAQGITLSPAFGYPGESHGELFLRRDQSVRLFREIFKRGKGRKWKFNQSSLFLDFLAGNRFYMCTPWGNVTRNVLGWQQPCYLLADGHAPTYQTLMEETDWDAYGPGRRRECTHCMLHSGFEATAVNDTLGHPFQALSVYIRGPATQGPIAVIPELDRDAERLDVEEALEP